MENMPRAHGEYPRGIFSMCRFTVSPKALIHTWMQASERTKVSVSFGDESMSSRSLKTQFWKFQGYPRSQSSLWDFHALGLLHFSHRRAAPPFSCFEFIDAALYSCTPFLEGLAAHRDRGIPVPLLLYHD
jgi:hypothetical protein